MPGKPSGSASSGRAVMPPRPEIMLAALILSTIGAIFKLYGGYRYGSRAVLVDGLTCIANLAAGAFLYYTMRRSLAPPDVDHPYGHARMVYLGTFVLVLAYTYTAGISTALLLESTGKHYTVHPGSAVYALLGSAAYATSVAVSARAGAGGSSYAMFTFSEVLEGVFSAGAAILGAELSSTADLAGAWIITAYIFYEVYGEARTLECLITDRTTPEVVGRVRGKLERLGFSVRSVRLRPTVPGRYTGDAWVVACNMPPDVADLLVDELVENLRREGIDVTVHIDFTCGPSRGRG